MSCKKFTLTWMMIFFGSLAVSYAKPSTTSRLRVAIVDTGLNLQDPRFQDVLCADGHKDFTGEGMYDKIGHGTHVAGILMRAAPDHSKYCLVIYKVKGDIIQELKAFDYAERHGVQLVNYSSSGSDVNDVEKATLSTSKMIFVVAAGNNGSYYKEYYPGGYGLPNVFAVGNWDCQSRKMGPDSNYGEGIIWRCGTNIKSTLPGGEEGYKTGTSMATPLYTAELIGQKTR